jgi:signal transduction histidine kinase
MGQLAERLFAEPPLFLALINAGLQYVKVSRCFADALGRETAYFPGKSVARHGFTPNHKAVMQKALDTNQTQILQNWTVVAPDEVAKTRGYWQWTIEPLHDSKGRIYGLVLFGCDVTERRLLESDVIEAAARERREVGLEIRDHIGQLLTAISMKAKILELKVEDGQSVGVGEIRELGDIATDVIAANRRIIHMLFPMDSETGGFLSSLERLAEDTTELYGVSCQLTVPDQEPHLEPVQAVNIHEIVKKVVEHSVRQAGAKDLAIEFSVKPEQYVVEIMHDGKAYKRTGAIKGYRMINFHAHTIGGMISVDGFTGALVSFTGRFPRTIGYDS